MSTVRECTRRSITFSLGSLSLSNLDAERAMELWRGARALHGRAQIFFSYFNNTLSSGTKTPDKGQEQITVIIIKYTITTKE